MNTGDEVQVQALPDGALFAVNRFTTHGVVLDGVCWRVSDAVGLWYPANTATTHSASDVVTVVSLGWTRATCKPRALERSSRAFWRAQEVA